MISTLRRNFFLGVCGCFLSNVDGFFADVETQIVKRYLFSKPHFRVFVVPDRLLRSFFALERNVPHLAWCE